VLGFQRQGKAVEGPVTMDVRTVARVAYFQATTQHF
jgi:hypothetical protein